MIRLIRDIFSEDFDTIIAATGYKIATPFFDPEFYEDCSAELLEVYRQKSGKKIEATAGWRLDEANLFLNKNNQKT